MSKPRQCDRRDGAATEVERWRRARLEASGMPAQLAAELAASDAYDLHSLLDLLDRGCPPELAARILAPLDRCED
jgi:hypothetical protein